jgi:hypothetical protein
MRQSLQEVWQAASHASISCACVPERTVKNNVVTTRRHGVRKLTAQNLQSTVFCGFKILKIKQPLIEMKHFKFSKNR